ncbi:MAG: PTS fructose transporter subunit IIA [Candidatus Omnitrophica bacterium CG23_combo_of_CG06-09_8_20_14_all_40_11]|nr:MAG: PTS fructose transporter subunit IIA [Candidatus Omnitrophica bacterium CG23_combo_of_CG06-09_8_20_14_all_40_11]
MTEGVKHRDIKLPDLLKDKYIELDLKEKEKTKLIAELVDIVVKSSRIKDGVLFKAILKREKLGSTAIGNGIAIPHVKIKGVKKPLLILGRSAEGVNFDALDGEKTYLFFMLISPQEEIGLHLKILAKISHLVKDKFVVERLKKVKDKHEIFEIISGFERYFK